MTAPDDFSPTDAEGLAAWFARAEANAAGLRRRLDGLGAEWQDAAPETVRGRPETGSMARRTGHLATSPVHVTKGCNNRPRRCRNGQGRR